MTFAEKFVLYLRVFFFFFFGLVALPMTVTFLWCFVLKGSGDRYQCAQTHDLRAITLKHLLGKPGYFWRVIRTTPTLGLALIQWFNFYGFQDFLSFIISHWVNKPFFRFCLFWEFCLKHLDLWALFIFLYELSEHLLFWPILLVEASLSKAIFSVTIF